MLAVGRFGRIEETSAVVAHLAGVGGGFITGASIAVDGGCAARGGCPPSFGGGRMHGEQSWRGAFSSAPVSSRSYGPPP
jgi:hypothetical protein